MTDKNTIAGLREAPVTRADDMLIQENRKLREALEFYADPDTYHAIGFFPDKPCGDFIEDFDVACGEMRPGKTARAALKETGNG